MGELAVDVLGSLCGDLDTPARRRLWLVGQIIGHFSTISELESAVDTAAKLELFIARGYRDGSLDITDREATPFGFGGVPNLDPRQSQGEQGLPPPAAPLDSHRSTATAGRYGVAHRPLLDGRKREEFIREAAENSDNRHLAQVFGLSVRQAHAIRVGLSKFITQAQNGQTAYGAKPNGKDNQSPVDREAELQMQEEFLRNRPPAPLTLDDVVRYLRQSDDVVVLKGENYVVNYSLTLTPSELIERANAKRHARTQPPFELDAIVAKLPSKSAHCGNGAP